MLTPEEELELFEKIKNGDVASTNKLVEANLRFVISVAKHYQNKGLPLNDLIQCGCEGIIEASKRWNAEKGVRFISYAVWWIRQSIIQALSSECRTIRVPMNQIVNVNKINKASIKLEQELGRNVDSEEISSETDLSISKVNLALSSITRSVSLDIPFNGDDVSCLLDVIPDSISTDKNIINKSISKEIENVLLQMPNRESDIIRMTFGIGVSQMTLEEISERFGITSERVRQLQNESIEYIRKNYSNDLKELL